MNKMNRKYFLSILLISLFAFFSCNFLGENLQETVANDESKGVKICLNFGNSRQIMPSNYTAAEYKLKGTFNSKETVWTYDSLSKLQSATLYLNYGEWIFTLEAYANDKLIASDTITRTISDTTNTLTFEYKVSELNYSEGTGNISVSISFPTDKKVSSVTAALYTTENLTTPIANTSTTYTTFATDARTGNYLVSYTKNAISSGSYYLIFKFYQSGVENSIGMWRDLVCVANGCSSSGESTVTEFNELYSINYHLNGIAFKSSYVAPATFNKSQSITLPTADNMDQTNLSFTGWYETADFSGDRITSWTYDSKTTDVNLYAKNTATVTFNMNNYGDQISSQTVVYGTKATEPVKPENDSMFFKGWFTDEALTQKYNFNSVLTANKIVYAKWVDLETYWSWTYPTSAPTLTWEGKGTQADPYIIMNSQELADLAYMVNNFTSYSGTYFVLGSDIELNYGKTVTGTDDTLNNWVPIGNTTYNFSGNFEGNGKKIKGLYINNDTLDNVGLFGIGNAPNNLTIDSGYITANATYAGGVIGYSKTAIENCTNKVALNNSKDDSYLGGLAGKGSSFKTCSNYGSLSGKNVGGICSSGSSFENCSNNGEINASGSYCGGIVSSSGLTLEIKNCSNNANITTQGDYLGGLAGYFQNSQIWNSSSSTYGVTLKSSIDITDSENTGKLTGTHFVGGIIAYLASIVQPYSNNYISSYYNDSSSIVNILHCISEGDIETDNGTNVGGICGYVSLKGHYSNNNNIVNCISKANIVNTSSNTHYLGGICGYVEGFSSSLEYVNILNSISTGRIEDNSVSGITIGGTVGSLKYGKAINCFSQSEISASVVTKVGGIAGNLYSNSYLTNCYYVAGLGVVSNASPTTGLKTSVGAVTSASGSVFSTDDTTLTYNGTLCEVLNDYRTENNLTNSYKEWIVGEDDWPTFAE